MIVKDVARDQDKVRSKLRRFLPELLESDKTGLTHPITRILLKPCDSQALSLRSRRSNEEAMPQLVNPI